MAAAPILAACIRRYMRLFVLCFVPLILVSIPVFVFVPEASPMLILLAIPAIIVPPALAAKPFSVAEDRWPTLIETLRFTIPTSAIAIGLTALAAVLVVVFLPIPAEAIEVIAELVFEDTLDALGIVGIVVAVIVACNAFGFLAFAMAHIYADEVTKDKDGD